MTTPAPTDEELALLCYGAEKGENYLRNGHRALFTAGERHMLELARMAAVGVLNQYGDRERRDAVLTVIGALESLRAPGETASEPKTYVLSGPSLIGEGDQATVIDQPERVEEFGDWKKRVEQAEPSRGGEPAFIKWLRERFAENATDGFKVGHLHPDAKAYVLALLDRPTPAASVPSEREINDKITIETMLGQSRVDKAERDRLKAQLDAAETELRIVKESRDEAAKEVERLNAQLVEVADKLREERAGRADLLDRVRGSTRWLREARRATNRSDFDACIDAAIESLLLHPPQPPEQSPEATPAKKPDEQR